MKKLLVPTDFSDNANNALAYAIYLANIFGSEITLLNTYKVYTATGSLTSVERYIKEDSERGLQTIVDRYSDQLTGGATIVTKILKGDTVGSIARTAEQGYDLIIMGTQGASGLAEIFIGSTTNGVIKNTKTPVLAVPEKFAYRPIENIVMAVDEEETFDEHLLLPLVAIAKQSGAMLRLYHKDVGNDGMNTAVDKFLEGIERTYHYELDSDNVNESINRFVKEQNADLLCMIRRQRSFIENIFHDSVTTNEVFNSPVPLLILQEK